MQPRELAAADFVDATVVVTAINHNCAVLTSDPDDLRKLADTAGIPIEVIPV